MEYMEISAKTVDDAITKACVQLELPSDRLDIEIISEGSKGFLGIGNKPAIIKVKVKEIETVEEEPKKKKAAVKEEEEKEKHSGNKKPSRRRKNNKKEEKESTVENTQIKEEKREPLMKTEEEIDTMYKVASEFLKNVFDAMDMAVEIKTNYIPDNACLEIELSGDDMGILIGKRGQTLDSLQYLTSLVLNKKHKEYIRVKLDTEDYRRRRKETLENLAKNIANKVKKTKKTVVLEPMNPYERRIIHSALQPNKDVETYSEGNEPYRQIVVAPKKRKEQ